MEILFFLNSLLVWLIELRFIIQLDNISVMSGLPWTFEITDQDFNQLVNKVLTSFQYNVFVLAIIGNQFPTNHPKLISGETKNNLQRKNVGQYRRFLY